MKKYIFLDIDGVIATAESVEEGEWGLVDSKQVLLGQILDKTDASIVLSSSWRKHTLQETKTYMFEKGFRFTDKIVGVTIRAYHYIEKGIHLSIPRGVEIKQWIDTNLHSSNGKIFVRKHLGLDYNYVIIDDDSDMLLEHKDNFVRTDFTLGLIEQDVEKAILILNKNV